MKPAIRDKAAPCGITKKKHKFNKHRKCKACNRCIFHIKLHMYDEIKWRCAY